MAVMGAVGSGSIKVLKGLGKATTISATLPANTWETVLSVSSPGNFIELIYGQFGSYQSNGLSETVELLLESGGGTVIAETKITSSSTYHFIRFDLTGSGSETDTYRYLDIGTFSVKDDLVVKVRRSQSGAVYGSWDYRVFGYE